MDCPACGAPTVAFTVPPDLREYLPGEESGAALCTRCLRLHPTGVPDDSSGAPPDFSQVSDAFPEGEAAVPMALLVGLLDSLAQYRAEITALLERVERAGTDPFLVVDRLADDSDVDAAADLPRRRHQLEQLL